MCRSPRRGELEQAAERSTRQEFADELLDPEIDLVPDPPDRLEVLSGRVVEFPVFVPLAGVDRAGIPATHCDHDVSRFHELVGERLRELFPQIDAELTHSLHGSRVDLLAGCAPGRTDVDSTLGAQLHEPGGHLAAAGVVHADEEDLGLLLHQDSFQLDECPKHRASDSSVAPRYRRRSMCESVPTTSMRVNIRTVKTLTVLANSCPPLLAAPLPAEDAENIARALKVLADPARLRLLSLIQSQPDHEACVCNLTEPLGLGQPTVSHHLKVLLQAGLVEREQRGSWAYFRVVPEPLAALRELLA